MKSLLRAAFAFAAACTIMVVLEATTSMRGRGVRKLLRRLRPMPATDDTVEARVRKKLARTAFAPESISATIEHGCVTLSGGVQTRERARIVRAIAEVEGVDSVVDLMTEPHPSPREQHATF